MSRSRRAFTSGLYAIVDADVCASVRRAPLDVAAAYLRAGVRLLQIRAKRASGREMLTLVEAVAALGGPLGAVVITNDRVDVARTSGTGVHLGQDDLAVADARAILGPDAVIGISTHTPRELAAAVRTSASYVAYGPVFATTTKANPDPVVGLEGVAGAALETRAHHLPLVAIGGIRLVGAKAVLDAGADAVAVIRDLLDAEEGPERRAQRFLTALAGEPV